MSEVKLHLFDMDHTLMDNDSDLSWKTYAVQRKLASPEALQQAEAYFEQYSEGRLDIDAFIRFQLQEFVGNTPETMRRMSQEHFTELARPKIYADAVALVRSLRQNGKLVGLLTATNLVLAKPLADFFGFDYVLGTNLEVRDGKYTGGIAGTYAGGPGKVVIARECAATLGLDLAEVAYYGDSINDRFILEAVGAPTAVNPSRQLSALAEQYRWPVLDFGPGGYVLQP